MNQVVRKEVHKLLEAYSIYNISDSCWVGITIIHNEKVFVLAFVNPLLNSAFV